MDLVLKLADDKLLTPYVYPPTWREDDILRQSLSLYVITVVGAVILYFILAASSFVFLFDKRLMQHPKFLKNQIRHEIKTTVMGAPIGGIFTTPCFLLHVRGYGFLYDSVEEAPFGYCSLMIEFVTFIMFTDACIYWIHRGLHHRLLYATFHKPHHAYKVPTPFASHAFHPVDGFVQSFPYHLYTFLFPMHKYLYLTFFVFVNFWTVSIHDGYFKVPDVLKPYINGSAHHTDHHLYYNYNYGQYFTLWDRMFGSFRVPTAYHNEGPIEHVIGKVELPFIDDDVLEYVKEPQTNEGEELRKR